MVAITYQEGGWGVVPTPRGTRVCVYMGRDYFLVVCAGGAWVARFPRGFLALSPWLELGPAWKLVKGISPWVIAIADRACIVRGSA